MLFIVLPEIRFEIPEPRCKLSPNKRPSEDEEVDAVRLLPLLKMQNFNLKNFARNRSSFIKKIALLAPRA